MVQFNRKIKINTIGAEKIGLLKQTMGEVGVSLNGLLSFLRLLEDKLDKEILQDYAARIGFSSTLISEAVKIVNSILLSEENDEPYYAKFNLKSILIAAVKLIENRALKRNLRIEFLYDDNIPEYFYGDGRKLFDVIYSLLENSLSVSQSGGSIRIRVHLIVLDTFGNASVYFEIMDCGKGHEKIFTRDDLEIYLKKEFRCEEKCGCTELHFACSNNDLKKYSSRLNCESIEGVGTRVYFAVDFQKFDLGN